MLFLEKLEQKRIYIVLVIIICILIGIIYGMFFVPKDFISSTSILLMKTEKNEDKKIENNGNIELTDNLIGTFNELLKSDSILAETKKSLNIENEISNKNIYVERISDSDTFQIQIKSINPNNAIDFGNALTKTFSKEIKNMYKDTEAYIVEPAHIIGTNKEKIVFISILISVVIGLVIDIIYIYLLIQIEKNIKNDKDIENNFSLKTLALIPTKNLKKKMSKELIISENEKTLTNKAFKKLRSNIQFLNVNTKSKNIILVTSPLEKEGKSYVSANLAISYANVGKKVILIDSDLNTGKQSKLFNIPNNMGLSNYLSGLDEKGIEITERINSFINETTIKNLNLITSGTVPPNSSELLSSPKLAEMLKDLSVFYDVIILDGTAILNSIDALILSRLSSSTLIVSLAKKTKKDDLLKTKRDIQNVGGRIIGVVLNKVKIKNKLSKTNIKQKFINIKNDIKEHIIKIRNSRKQKLLEEPKNKEITKLEIIQVKDKKQDNDFEKNTVIVQEISKIEENTNKEEYIKLDEEKDIVKPEILKEETIKNKNYINIKNIKKKCKKLKIIIIKTYKNIEKTIHEKFNKKIIKDNKNEENGIEDKNIKFNSENKIDLEENINLDKNEEPKNDSEIKLNKSKENVVLVVLDSQNAVCRAFSKECYTEKLVRGLDKNDGFMKAYYSSYLIKKRMEALMLMYSINKIQASRIDPLIYAILSDYDEIFYGDKKRISNKAESYVLCMAKEYERNIGETKKEYLKRCQNSRKESLYNNDIEIEYSLDFLWKNNIMKLSDKFAINKFSKIYSLEKNKVDYEENKYVQNYSDEDFIEEIEDNFQEEGTTTTQKVFRKISGIKAFQKIGEVKNSLINVEQVKAKSVKEIAEEVNIELNNQNDNNQKDNYVDENINLNNNFENFEIFNNENNLEINNADTKIEQENMKQEKRKEIEIFKKIQKEKNAKKRKEQKEKKQKQREEKDKQRAEQKRAKELEREKKIEEARIEEELLGDNLYPKTKNNKSL